MFAQSQQSIDSIQQIIKENKSDSSVVHAYIGWGELLQLNYPDSALKKFQIAKSIAETALENKLPASAVVKYKQLLSSSLNNIGYYYYVKSKLQEALTYYYKCLKLNEEINNKEGIAFYLSNIGVIQCYYLKENAPALINFERSLSLYTEIKNKSGEGDALHNIAAVYQAMGDTVTALNYYFKCILIKEEFNELDGLSDAYNNIAVIYDKNGELDKALAYHKKSLDINKELNDERTIAYSTNHIANIYFKQGKTDKAEKLAREALQIGLKNNYPDLIKSASSTLHKILKSKNRWKDAYEMLLLYEQMRDSINITDARDNASFLQAKYEFEKRTVADSIKYISTQREKDIKIRQQKSIRNSIIIITTLLLALGLLLFNRYRIVQINKQNKLQITSLDTEQKLLRAQMNPHFIYNSLNSIQSLILENETHLAREYLITFSRLTRAVLEQTKKKTISLNKEIETLQMYLEMEKLRFNNKFKYEIKLTQDLEPEIVFIPPLIIQPFVENSIIHGISRKETEGNILIEFSITENILKCIIQDDGVGRRKAAEFNNNNPMKGLSIATQLAKNRLNLTNKNGKEISAIFITDLSDETGKAIGTRVEINIDLSQNNDENHNY